MKRPKEPARLYPPYKPVVPVKYLPATNKTFKLDHYSCSLADLLKAAEGIDPAKVYFNIEGSHSYYDGIDIEASIHWEDPNAPLKPNPYYEKQMEHYKAALENYKKLKVKYDEDKSTYDARLSKYNEEYKKYLIWFHGNQLTKLKKAAK